ncbi:hypothetical protein PMSD_25135 [Paenibacillus macquariensis subsp. defensor]|nr:hypothetical protein PMSD_25135 [Paenibacillus macquariensis subsp. defensor]
MSNKKTFFGLTEPQKRIFYTQMIYSDSSMFNIGGPVTVKGNIHVEILRQAILVVAASHDAFQIRLTVQDGNPMQYFCETSINAVDYIDFRGRSGTQEIFQDWVQSKAGTPFILEDSPLYDFTVFTLNDNTHGYLVKLHHIIADGWSIQILTDQISRIYDSLASGEPTGIEHSTGYKEYMESSEVYLSSQRYTKNKAFWNEMFHSLPEDRMVRNSIGLEGKRKSFYLSQERRDSIYEYCNTNQISMNSFFVSLHLLFLNKSNGNEDNIIGNPVLGRSGRKERQTIGMFVSSLPFRYRVSDSNTVGDMIRDIDRLIKGIFAHQKYPYNHLVKDLNLDSMPLYTACVNYYNTTMGKEFNGFPVEHTEFYNGQQEYDIQLIVREWADSLGLQVDIDYKTALYTEPQIKDMMYRLEILIDKILTNSGQRVSKIGLLSQVEEKELLQDYNNTYYEEYPSNQTIIDLFADQVALTPNRVAIQDKERNISYTELDERSTCLAVKLRSSGVSSDIIVGILTDHSIETVIGILGVLKAGGAYLPIDSQCPLDRLMLILQDASVGILLTNKMLADDLPSSLIVLNLNLESTYLSRNMQVLSNSYCGLDNLAYVIYTSGSTGKPKGVMIEHKALLHYISWAKRQYVKLDIEIFPLYSSLSFDLTVTSIFTPLISGGVIRIYRDDEEVYVLNRILEDDICTILKITPAHLTLIKEYARWPFNIHTLIIGGENLKSDLAKDIFEGFQGRVTLYNEYGPTEATVGCMIHKFDPQSDIYGSVPIGKPGENCRIYVLDKNLNPVPVGVLGDLYISGNGIARGYLNRMELTAEKFIGGGIFELEKVLYKSGDIAKFIDKHTVMYAGRRDSQVKIRGYRIELGEIEEWICRYPNIEGASVAVYGESDNTPYLFAYYVSKEKNDETEMRHFLLRHLPLYMVPAFFVCLDRFPIDVNGKVDKKHLPVPNRAHSAGEITDFLDQEGRILISVISRLLEKNNIHMNDNYYHIGGDSIKAIQVSSKLYELGYTLKANDILSNPVLRDMMFYLKKINPVKEVNQGNCEGTIKTMPIIQWFLSRKLYNPNIYCQAISLEMKKLFSIDVLERILTKLIEHHDSLRVNWDHGHGTLFYNNQFLNRSFEIKEWNILDEPEESIEKKILCIRKKTLSSMDIANDLLVRSFLCNTSKGQVWDITIHHLAIDGISWRILFEDIQTMLNQAVQGETFQLPPKTHSFQKWADDLEQSQSIPLFQTLESGMEPVPYSQKLIKVEPNETTLLMTTANDSYHTKPIELMLSAMILSLTGISSMSGTKIEFESHGRNLSENQTDISRTVGWFTRLYTLSLEHIPLELSSLIVLVKETYRNTVGEMEIHHESIVNSCKKRDENLVRMNFLGDFQTNFDFFTVLPSLHNEAETTADLEIDAIIVSGQMQISIRARNLFLSADQLEDFSNLYLQSLQKVVEHCHDSKDIQFTPSDFIAVSLTQDDLDIIFE